jgi:hypothetical protein
MQFRIKIERMMSSSPFQYYTLKVNCNLHWRVGILFPKYLWHKVEVTEHNATAIIDGGLQTMRRFTPSDPALDKQLSSTILPTTIAEGNDSHRDPRLNAM